MDIFTAISKGKVDYSRVVIFILTKKKLEKLMNLDVASAMVKIGLGEKICEEL